MNSEKYIGLDVHQATIVVAVTDSTGKLIMESILETEAATILQFFAGLRGTLSVTFEEGTWSAWLYDLLNPHVNQLVVCNPRKNALLKDGNKSDRIDARKLAGLLRGNQLKPVYHGETGVRMLRELSRSYLTIVKDLSRVMNRLKAVYRSWAIPCAGRDVYYTRNRAQWLAKIREAGVRRRAERLYEQLDMLQHLRQQARRELLAESRKHAITAKLRQIPYLGPIRSALAVALIQTPHRFRSKQPAGHLDSRTLRSALGRERPNPLLLLCKLMVERAFRDACQVDRHGSPTMLATESVEWIQSDLDWTHTGMIPPPDLRREFYLSFQHCCRWLDLDPDVVRQQGLPRDVCTADPRKRRMNTRPRHDVGRNSRHHVFGLPDVYAHWEAASKRHAHEQHSDSCTAVVREQEQELLCAL